MLSGNPDPTGKRFGRPSVDPDATLLSRKTRLCSKASENKVFPGFPFPNKRYSESTTEPRPTCAIVSEQSFQNNTKKPVWHLAQPCPSRQSGLEPRGRKRESRQQRRHQRTSQISTPETHEPSIQMTDRKERARGSATPMACLYRASETTCFPTLVSPTTTKMPIQSSWTAV